MIFRSGPESLGHSPSRTRSGEGASPLSGGIDLPFRAVVIVVVIVVVVVGEMRMNVIHDWRLEENFTTLLRG